MNVLIDLVDNCTGVDEYAGELKPERKKPLVAPGKEVLIIAHKDGLYNGENLIDEETVSWLSSVITSRGARCSVLWVDDPQKPHEWRYPPVVKAAVAGADLIINTTFQMAVEEIAEFRNHIEEVDTWMVRLFPVTKELLMTNWAQTPYELTKMMRHVASNNFIGKPDDKFKFVMTDINGTHLEGNTVQPKQRPGVPGHGYASWRRDASHYLPFPEWVHPPINCENVNGIFIFNSMLSWWSPVIDIDPEWETPITIEVKDSRMVNITGGLEAAKLNSFLKKMVGKVGEDIYKFDTFHFGIHPNAKVSKYQCPHDLYRRIIDHMHTSNLHWHLGSAGAKEGYNFYPHVTGDIRNSDLIVNGKTVYDKGWLTCQNDPEVAAVAAKYPGRPGIPERF
ncbi:MAG: hypothetical protein LBU43_04170 [Candidatus Accumulibacter sp.]|jgi:hypothetical protein|nr:hypothetical protein [Accumulibacter sp.]